MTLLALTKSQQAGGEIALAVAFAVMGVVMLLPRPRGRIISGGIAALIAAVAVCGAWAYRTFGTPVSDTVGTVLFCLFSAGALIFGAMLVVQKNPARGAIAFAFVILSTCGLFLLLAAPFLMAATIIIYAGAIIVTFLFVLMLSNAEGPSDENDRSREPLYGGFAGFAFTGLVLFTLFQTSQASAPATPGQFKPDSRLPAQVLTAEEAKKLDDVIARLDAADTQLDGDLNSASERNKRVEYFEAIKNDLTDVVGQKDVNARDGSLRSRLEKAPVRQGRAGEPDTPAVLYREDPQARDVLKRAASVRELNTLAFARIERAMLKDGKDPPDVPAAKAEARKLRDEVVLLRGAAELPADNVRNLGFVLYSEHLLAIELAGTLLLVAVIGAVAIAQRKGVAK
jgi:NADH-quinone oxidoreductase subunit J